MQSVSAAFTAEETDDTRVIASNLQASWKRFSLLANRTFTIGTSTIGGNDLIGINPGAVGNPGNYKYFDESAYVTRMAWERGYNMPTGGLTKALAEAELDNTSGRFTPRYMGGNSELFTSSYLPKRPFIINAGFNIGGVDITIPKFSGITTEPAQLNARSRTVSIKGADYIDYFQNKSLDQTAIFTGQRTDQIYASLSSQLGMNTAQYDYDTGINVIPFAMFEAGTKFSDIFHQLAEAENGHFLQDESGIFKFESRYHWQNSPYTDIQRVVFTGQVIDVEGPSFDHIINTVEVRSKAYLKQPEQIIYRLNPFDSIFLTGSTATDVFVDFDDPVLSMTTPTGTGAQSYYKAFNRPDGTGLDLTSNISITKVTRFAQSAKITFTNSGDGVYLTNLVITGRVARNVSDIYTRAVADSVTPYDERLYQIDNPFIQSQVSAESYAQMILQDYSVPENLQKITIRAMPELQLGDLISWQGRYWRIFEMRETLDAQTGFVQELTLLQRSIASYFRIGVSTIAGSDKIGP